MPFTPPDDQIEAELTRVLDSRSFGRAPRQRALLRYLIDSRGAVSTSRLKESTIALDVFERNPATYDTATDGIVRVSVNRLRELLDRYYEGEGAGAALRFEIQRGSYAPIIRRMTPTRLPNSPRIAVLPLANFTGDVSLHALCDGLTDDLIDSMTRVPGVRVIARTSSFRYRDSMQDIREIAAQLEVEALLEGSVQFAGDRLRVTAQLILGHDRTHLWSHAFEASATERGSLQAALIDMMMRSLGKNSAGSERVVVALEEENVPVLARNLIDRARAVSAVSSVDSLQHVENLAREATQVAPEYATAWATLASMVMLQRTFWGTTAPVALDTMRGHLQRSLDLDPNSPAALSLKGYDRCVHDNAWAEGLPLVSRAIELAPTNAVFLYRHAVLLRCLGRFDESRHLFDEALRLDPFRPVHYHGRCWLDVMLDNFPAAQQLILLGRARLGNLAIFDDIELAADIQAGRYEATLPRAESSANANPRESAFGLRRSQCLAALNRLPEARALFAEHAQHSNPNQRSYLLMAIKACGPDTDAFFMHANDAIESQATNCGMMAAEGLFRRFHSDPRWALLMTRLKRSTVAAFTPHDL